MIPRFLKNEDVLSTFIGLLLLASAFILPNLYSSLLPDDYISGIPIEYRPVSRSLLLILITLPLFAIGAKFMGEKVWKFSIAFIVIFLLSIVAQLICKIPFVKGLNIESVFIAVAIGLIIRNVFGLPKFLTPAVRSEYYIKAGLVMLGSSILFHEVMKAGSFGMIQAIVVVISVWYFTFFLSKKMKVDDETGIMLSSAVSICGVSAAIAAGGAIKADGKKLSLVVSLVLICAIPMMYIMPYVAKWLGLSPEVAGAW